MTIIAVMNYKIEMSEEIEIPNREQETIDAAFISVGEGIAQGYQFKTEDLKADSYRIKVLKTIDGVTFETGYPICRGCDELTVCEFGMLCFYEMETPNCQYADSMKDRVKEEAK